MAYRRRLPHLEVSIEDGMILVNQTIVEGGGGHDDRIEIHPDQLDTLIGWLTEAAAEIRGVALGPKRVE